MTKSLRVILACLTLGLTVCTQSVIASNDLRGSTSAPQTESLVLIQSQPDAPLQLSLDDVKRIGSDQSGVEIFAKVKNISERQIRAYALRDESIDGGQEGGGCFLQNAPTAGKILKPGQSEGRTLWHNLSRTGAQLRVSVDFVEFANGSVWGPDACKSAEQLDGQRAGGRVAKRLFKKKLDERGFDILMSQLYVNDSNLASPEGRSDAWKAGFRGAVNTLRERLRRANEEGGVTEVEAVLQRPVDASDN